ncbi:MAG: imidazole glycerol phosphate synthase subunit HisH [Spirochaetaceae bacterium]|jgi:imidazoleglycerol phosphate synthase glutamine amidotransferase subunit HisH|nr:imidazole glycerol phosphate synthase subunit HisH [Spirochaetaceae bacterium]
MIGVIDYGAGNLGSVMNALKRLGVPARFAAGPEELRTAADGSAPSSPFDRIIFPGDGHFATAMETLEQSGYAQVLREWIGADRPFLGICIGLQLLLEYSEEAGYVPADVDASANAGTSASAGNGAVKGLGVLPGTVRRFPGRKIPQIGWNQTAAKNGSRLFRGLPADSFFYYIHSYYAAPDDSGAVSAEAEYYVRYCSAVEKGELAAVQFHPEKSGPAGLRLLENWVRG